MSRMQSAIAARIQQARIAAGYRTPEAAAIELALNPEIYKRHERGKAAAKPESVRRYATTFGVTTGWLVTGVGLGPKG